MQVPVLIGNKYFTANECPQGQFVAACCLASLKLELTLVLIVNGYFFGERGYGFESHQRGNLL